MWAFLMLVMKIQHLKIFKMKKKNDQLTKKNNKKPAILKG